MATNDKISRIEEILHDKFLVPPTIYVMLEALTATQTRAESYKDGQKDAAKQIFKELDNLHVIENWGVQKGNGMPLLLKQIGAYAKLKKRFEVDLNVTPNK